MIRSTAYFFFPSRLCSRLSCFPGHKIAFLRSTAFPSSPTLALALSQGAYVTQPADIVFETPFSAMIRSGWMLMMRNGPSALRINILSVRLSVYFECVVIPANGGWKQTLTSSFWRQMFWLRVHRRRTYIAFPPRSGNFQLFLSLVLVSPAVSSTICVKKHPV